MDMSTSSAAADAVRGRFYDAKAAILADPQLNGQGKSQRIAAAAEKANAEIDKIQADAEGGIAAERSALEKKLLTAPTPSVMATATDRIAQTTSFRDAIARAQMTEPDMWSSPESTQLLELQRTALLTGDELLARATMVVAMQRGDATVVNAFEAANPKLLDDVERLWELTHQSGSGTLNVATMWAFVHVAV